MFNKKTIYLILTGLCFLAYANSLNNGFISDDIPAILENPGIARPWSYWSDQPSLLNCLIYLSAGLNPFAYHLASIILHSLNTILAFIFLSLFFQNQASLLGAALFALHPVHTEAVTWISGKPYLFLTFFTLVTYLLYHRATSRPSGLKRFSPFWYCLSLASFSYFIIDNYSFFLLFPLFLALTDFTLKRGKENWRWWLPFAVIAIIRIILAYHTISSRILGIRNDIGVPVVKNPILFFVYSFCSHLWLLIWPAKLTFYHDPAIPLRALFYYSMLCLLLLIPLLCFTFKKAKEIFLSLSIFIVFLIPTYSPVPVASLVAERYLYLPSLALSIAIAFLFDRFRYEKFKKHLLVVLLLIIFLYTARTIFRNRDWQDPGIFWRKTALASPNSARAHNSLGLIYLKERDIEAAIKEYKRVIEINPEYAKAYNNLGVAYNELGDTEKAMAYFEKAIEINPKLPDACHNLGLAHNELGDRVRAMAYFEKAIEIDPEYVDAYNSLGAAYKELSDKEKAITYFEKAIKLNPRYATAYYNLGIIYSDSGSQKEAIALYEKAIKINPHYIKAYNNLSSIYINIGRDREAIPLLKKAIQIDPHCAAAHFNLYLAYLNEKEDNLAIKHYEEAKRLDIDRPKR